jgi:hypothetical protein
MIRKFRMNAMLTGVAILCSSMSSLAGFPVASGQIDTLYAAQGTNYAFRVYLTGVSPLCAGGGAWAYTNVADDNYKVYVSTLTTAYAMGRPISLTMEVINGTCHILEVWMRSN